jgi:hypothetical protein
MRSGSSRPIEAVCGHHAPSRLPPSSAAKVNLTGLLKRRPHISLVMTKPVELQEDRRISPCDPWTVPSVRGRRRVRRSAYELDRTLIVFARVSWRITVDYETVHL